MEAKPKIKRILIAPLDWGLGHASRCIPVIKEIRKQGAHVVIAADRRPLKLLKSEFPQCESVRLPGMEVSYPKKVSMSAFMALKAPTFFKAIANENKLLQKLVENYKIDGVISDNRYGLSHEKIPSILMTHQLFIQTPLFKGLLEKLTANYIENFQACWIPDFSGDKNLSGDLSHQASDLKHLQFIGPISRFSDTAPNKKESKFKRKLMVILSGPEPNRSSFEKLVLKQLKTLDFDTLIVRGLVDNKALVVENKWGKITMKSHLNSDKMKAEIYQSEMVLCRSGYSSVMDLAVLGKKAILVPTKGQTEQEYLSKHLQAKNWFYSTTEENLDIAKDIEKAKEFSVPVIDTDNILLSNAVEEFLKSC